MVGFVQRLGLAQFEAKEQNDAKRRFCSVVLELPFSSCCTMSETESRQVQRGVKPDPCIAVRAKRGLRYNVSGNAVADLVEAIVDFHIVCTRNGYLIPFKVKELS